MSIRPLGEAKSKSMRAYAQSGQYHIIVAVVIPNMVLESCP